jgi:hypothetical protein
MTDTKWREFVKPRDQYDPRTVHPSSVPRWMTFADNRVKMADEG